MSTDLLAHLAEGSSPMPLVAVDNGRFPGVGLRPASDFSSCRLPAEAYAGWLLYAGYGARSHNISQDAHTPEGSYWHGIYHRMEPDAWNAKYWFRQVGSHPIVAALAESAANLGYKTSRNWDHSRFVDFVGEALASRDAKRIALAEAVQLLEWRLLFDYCVKDFS